MEQTLQKEHYRSVFYVLIGVILSLSVIIRLFIIPYLTGSLVSWEAFFTSFFDNFIVTLIITVFIGSFIFWLTPKNAFRAKMEVIDAKEINPTLKSVLNSTRFWIYKGACGRYTRATTIPQMAEAAKNSGFSKEITICILSPTNQHLCNEYATYRRSLKSADAHNPWNVKTVQAELIATIVTALKYRYLQPRLKIRIFLVDHFSAFRLDVSDQFVVVTKEDKTASALKANVDTYFYESYKDDILLTERQSKEIVNFPDLEFDESPITKIKLEEVLSTTHVFSYTDLEEKDITQILSYINSPKDPY